MHRRLLFCCSVLVLAACTAQPPVGNGDGSSSAAYGLTADAISLDGETVIRASDIPNEIQVSADAAFGASGDFTSFAASPGGRWLAFSTHGAAHDAGWIYDTQTETLRPVVFQFGGGVEVEEWADGTHVVFLTTTPEPRNVHVTIDVEAPPAYPRLIENGSGTGETTWEMYQSEETGISIEYPGEMTINEGGEAPNETAAVRFSLWGPTQTADTELFDGIMVSVARGTHEGDLRSYVEEQVEQARDLGEVTEPLATTTIAGRSALTYTASTLGVYTNTYVSLGSGTFLRVSALHPDPTGQGFADTVDRMLETLEIR